ncbi:GntR family transcriptional regulator [Jiella sp. MQZ9-1]|uniref:GntR family transcriptional regulator n=1 Tax=Jiella flava TaxID=2816857 RepID=A0A939FXA1_9HYPH|nr:GntR family transcriptional regulator [Jiella flava]MBO0662574.1 GntR family transcriptional regulator [Jiella flava]MCD2472945.1 GntR family transcriptional regulator [Jiella flava]
MARSSTMGGDKGAGERRRKAPGDGENLGRKAYSVIRAMIMERQLAGGDILSEEKLAAELGFSRTPVREAMFLLQNTGLIQKEMNQPFRVRLVSNREYFQSMRLRELLEGEAIAAAVQVIDAAALATVETAMLALRDDPNVPAEIHWAADEKLHDMIADASGNEVMAQVIASLRVTTRLYELSGLPSRFRPDTEEHIAIIDAIRSGDPTTARSAMQTHIRSLTNDVLAAMARL